MTDLEVSSSEAIADWIETSTLVSASGHLSRDRLDDLGTTELGLPQTRVSMGLGVMTRRAAVLGDRYPFTVNDFAVLRRNGNRLSDAYATLLCLTPESIAR